MSAAAPWSVKGIDPRAREIAKDLARRQGLTLGDWLNRMIMDDTSDAALAEQDAGGIAGEEFERLSEALDRLGARVVSAESRSTLAISGIDQTVLGVLSRLEASFSEFDQRLRAAEAPNQAPDAKLEQLAQDLARNFEVAREELTGKLEQAVDQRFEGVEQSLKHMTSHMQAAEQRSTRAMERMGREVLRVAEALGQRMEGVETRSAQAIVQVGGEVSRIADVMEGRVRKADQVQAESLERLGVEIARI